MNCIRVVRAARNVTPAFKRGYFTQTFSDKDKFATELKGDYPTIVEGLEGEFAKELFRYAYNNNQLGYYKVALEYVNGLNAPHRFAEEEFQASLKDAGVPDVVRTDFLSNVSESLLSNNFPEIVAAYEELYKANYRVEFGTITLGTVSVVTISSIFYLFSSHLLLLKMTILLTEIRFFSSCPYFL